MASYHITMSLECLRDLGALPPAVHPRAVRTCERMVENPWAKELHPEKVRGAEDGIRSCRVDNAYRIIWKHIKPSDVVLCLIDNHDEAYRRARRKHFSLEDGVVRMADIIEVGAKAPDQRDGFFGWLRGRQGEPGTLFINYSDDQLREFGVPESEIPLVRALDDIKELDVVEPRIPEEAHDKLCAIALGIVERPVVPDSRLRESLERHQGGDDLHRFVDSREFKRALAGEMEDWMLFLAPHQKALINRTYNGPARVKGVAGSGKTVVAIHRARYLAREALEHDKKVLFLTFGNRLPRVIYHLLTHLAGEDSPELGAVECVTVHQWCYRFLNRHGNRPNTAPSHYYWRAIDHAVERVKPRYPQLKLWSKPTRFFKDEISYAIKGRAISSREEYLALDRSGRGTPLQESEREAAYDVYRAYQETLDQDGKWDFNDYVIEALRLAEAGELPDKYSAAVVDEIQDLSAAVMRLIRRIVPEGTDDLFLVGDGLQRIYPGGYVLGRLGISITGRGTLLRRNYRNTQEILRAAHAMMEGQRFNDMDAEDSIVQEPEYSVRSGKVPVLHRATSPTEEMQWVQGKIAELSKEEGYDEGDFALLYRWRDPYEDLIGRHLSDHVQLVEIGRDAATYFGPGTKHTTFHSAKGLEFKVVFVVGVTDGQFVPKDDWSLEGEELADHLARERRLLYVAMTRARDRLYLTCSRGQPSRFLADIPQEFLERA